MSRRVLLPVIGLAMSVLVGVGLVIAVLWTPAPASVAVSPAPAPVPPSPSAPSASVHVPLLWGGHADNPVWGPGGAYLAVETNDLNGHIALAVFRPTRDDPKQVTSAGADGHAYAASWHPSGFMVFTQGKDGQPRLYFSQPPATLASELLHETKAEGAQQRPAVAPDGNTVAYVVGEVGEQRVDTWDPNTDAFATVLDGAHEVGPLAFDADGQTLAGSVRDADGEEDLWVVDLAANDEPTRLALPGSQSRPVFVGETLVFFTETASDGWVLQALTLPDGEARTLVDDVRLPTRGRPALSPEREWVVVAKPASSELWAVHLDSGRSRVFKVTGHAVGEPALADRDGRLWLAYTALESGPANWRQLYVRDITGVLD